MSRRRPPSTQRRISRHLIPAIVDAAKPHLQGAFDERDALEYVVKKGIEALGGEVPTCQSSDEAAAK
jgi:hypothetical protein